MIDKNLILEELKNEFAEEHPTEISYKKDNGVVDMFIVEFAGVGQNSSEVLAEMFFAPQPLTQPKYELFTIAMTIEDDYKGKNFEELLQAMTFINYNTPFGAFVLDNKATTITLKYTLLVDPDEDMEKLVEEINYSLANMVTLCGLWMDVMFDVINGKAKLEDVMKVIFPEQK